MMPGLSILAYAYSVVLVLGNLFDYCFHAVVGRKLNFVGFVGLFDIAVKGFETS